MHAYVLVQKICTLWIEPMRTSDGFGPLVRRGSGENWASYLASWVSVEMLQKVVKEVSIKSLYRLRT